MLADAINPLWGAPFVLLLACIALMPFIRRHWWEHHYPKVVIALAVIPAAYYWLIARRPGPWIEYMEEYAGFIIFLGSLYIVSGGILIHVGRRATPTANVTLLLIGSLLANIVGTTGASMLLIRPFLRMNRDAIRPYHVVFFIFTVSNVGGGLTPIGDPPLFLGYLQGVPFWWVFERCRLIWAFTLGLLLAVFFVIDKLDHGKSPRRSEDDPGPAVHILGVHNFLLIGLLLFAIFRPGFFHITHDIGRDGFTWPLLGQLLSNRELLMIIAIVLSRRLTGRDIYERNAFTFGPIREVAILFLGIFSTMVPALEYLRANAERFALRTPGQFYFTSGTLSSLLDNAPTYLTFLELKLGMLNKAGAGDLQFLVSDPRASLFLVAISMGSVFFGACTYIGNGPNFMVKSIAESAGAPTPSFLTYVVKYTLPVLVPIYVLVWWLFLR